MNATIQKTQIGLKLRRKIQHVTAVNFQTWQAQMITLMSDTDVQTP